LKSSKAVDYDTKWLKKLQHGVPPPFQFVTEDATWSRAHCWEKLRSQRDKPLDFDVIVAGGEMGIFLAMALQMKGFSVCVVDGADLVSDDTEWHVSMDELNELKSLGILDQADIDAAIQTVLPETKGVKDVSVSPRILLERVATRFQLRGGSIFEQSPLMGVAVSEYTGVAVDLGEDKEPLTASLVIDCLGYNSPMARQQRYGMKPDGVCAVVGSCAAGFKKESDKKGESRFMTPKLQNSKNGKQQYFWESYPSEVGKTKKKGMFGFLPGYKNEVSAESDVKTTYLYTYMDAEERRTSLASLMNDYWKMLSDVQPTIKDPAKDLDVKRVLFAYFPTYRDSPLKYSWSRMLAVDIQNPMNFGGFGPLVRHIGRISGAISEALDNQCLHKDDLAAINAYMPSQNVAHTFHEALSARMGNEVDPKFVDRLLAGNFKAMKDVGPQTINPFLQDIARFGTLMEPFARTVSNDSKMLPPVVQEAGPPAFLEGMKHLGMMGIYSLLDSAVAPRMEAKLDDLSPRDRFKWRRRMEAWKVGSGNDFRKAKFEKTEGGKKSNNVEE